MSDEEKIEELRKKRMEPKVRGTTPVECPVCKTVRAVRTDNLKIIKSNICRPCYRKSLHKHGKSTSKLYTIWVQNKSRCRNSGDYHYARYGGRGILWSKVWEEFPPFEKWASAHGYADGKSFVRINKDGHFEPNNCEFV